MCFLQTNFPSPKATRHSKFLFSEMLSVSLSVCWFVGQSESLSQTVLPTEYIIVLRFIFASGCTIPVTVAGSILYSTMFIIGTFITIK